MCSQSEPIQHNLITILLTSEDSLLSIYWR